MTQSNDRLNNTKDKALGEVKETVGKATGNEELELKGKIQSLKSDVMEKSAQIKEDAVEKINKFVDEKKAKNNKL